MPELLYRKKIGKGFTNLVSIAKKHTKNIDFSILKLKKKQKVFLIFQELYFPQKFQGSPLYDQKLKNRLLRLFS